MLFDVVDEFLDLDGWERLGGGEESLVGRKIISINCCDVECFLYAKRGIKLSLLANPVFPVPPAAAAELSGFFMQYNSSPLLGSLSYDPVMRGLRLVSIHPAPAIIPEFESVTCIIESMLVAIAFLAPLIGQVVQGELTPDEAVVVLLGDDEYEARVSEASYSPAPETPRPRRHL